MSIVAGLVGVIMIVVVLADAFLTIILPRRVVGPIRLTSLFYRLTWQPYRSVASRMHNGGTRESFLGFFGPLSLLALVAMWAVGLLLGFALLQYAAGSSLAGVDANPGFGTDVYMSGTTFFTLGLGDVTPHSALARLLAVVEAGMGFAFLALIIGYLPALNQAFSRREVNVSLLDARAGSPPTAGELLRRHGVGYDETSVVAFLSEWERWSAELLESQLSYPVLCFFRSQHEHQSWLTAITAILDTCALLMAGGKGPPARQARLTFAIARHATVDLSQIIRAKPSPLKYDRLPPEDLTKLLAELAGVGIPLKNDAQMWQELAKLRDMYEPYVHAMAESIVVDLPPWIPTDGSSDAWTTTAWENTNVRTAGD
ncbi:MAG: potassium channel family protein [Chloroflexota bacterium]|nr:potassium channel family protein [Chloroflexota bacterium]